MDSFKKFGFRLKLKNKDGDFDYDNTNFWQVHVWNSSYAKDYGYLFPFNKAVSFDELITLFRKTETGLDEEEISNLIIRLIECGCIEIEEISSYETDLYSERIKFWEKR